MTREQRVYAIANAIELLSYGKTQKEVAKELMVSDRTIRNWIGSSENNVEYEKYMYENLNSSDIERRVLVIGDLHEPFSIKGAIEFAKKTYKDYNCNTVVFMGDIIDNHSVSYHEKSTDGLGGSDELRAAISNIRKWYEAFPNAYVIIGNHDRLITRKAQTGSIPKEWIKTYQEVLGTKNWVFTTELVLDNVKYIHGEAGKARSRMKQDLISTVQGHYHNDMYIDYAVGQRFRIFGMQVGCLVDRDSYGMSYARHFPKQAIGLGVILNNGKLPIIIPAELGNGEILIE